MTLPKPQVEGKCLRCGGRERVRVTAVPADWTDGGWWPVDLCWPCADDWHATVAWFLALTRSFAGQRCRRCGDPATFALGVPAAGSDLLAVPLCTACFLDREGTVRYVEVLLRALGAPWN
jgi:hypothetical protein